MTQPSLTAPPADDARFLLSKAEIVMPGEARATREPAVAEAFAERRAILRQTDGGVLVALPDLRGEDVPAVTLLTIDTMDAAFAAEIWAKEPHRSELGLVQSAYAGLERLAAISPLVKFPLGAGLPGTVWQTGRPAIVEDLPHAEGFLRTVAAEDGQLDVGIGWPLVWLGRLAAAVVVLLSTDARPLCRGSSVWLATDDGTFACAARSGIVAVDDGAVHAVAEAGLPVADDGRVLILTRIGGKVDSLLCLEL